MRILILRTSAMGDIVHALPVLAALKRNLPEATIGWVVEKPFAVLLDQHADVDALFPVELRRWRRQPAVGLAQAASVRRDIDGFDADIAVDLMGNHKAGAIAAVTRVPRVLGLARRDRREPSSAVWMTDTAPALGTHAVDRTLSILRGLGIDPGEVDFQPEKLLPRPADPAPPADPYFVIQVGAGWANKCYPAAALGDVARRIAAQRDLRGYVAHGPGEVAEAEEAMIAGDGALVDAVPTGLASLGFWLRRAELVIGGDTGPVHLADALGTDVLMLMGPTSAERHGPYQQRDNTIRVDLPCSPCYQRFSGAQSCMTHLPPAAVADRAVSVLCGRRLTASDTLLRLSEPLPPLCRSSARKRTAG